ncbi:MAG: SIR2 family protein [Phycisphaerales bacterium]
MSIDETKLDQTLMSAAEGALKEAYEQHEEFNAALDKQNDEVVIQSLIKDQKPWQVRPSEVIYLTDRIGYEVERAAWQEREIRDKNSDAFRVIMDGEHQTAIHDLATAIARGRVAPFVGAGLSAFAYPLWGDALKTLIDRIGDLDRETIHDLIDSGQYLEAAQGLWEADSITVKAFIRDRFGINRIGSGDAKGAVPLLKAITNGCIITTNFDSVIEQVVGDGQFDGYMHGLQRSAKFNARLISGDRCLMKLHGDSDDDSTYILTQDQYTAAYGDPLDYEAPVASTLRHIFLSHSLLFLGCSLEQDRTLELLADVCSKNEQLVPDHYAIIVEPEGGRAKVEKEQRLRNMKIRPIWYPPNKHHYVEQILRVAIALSEGSITSLEPQK